MISRAVDWTPIAFSTVFPNRSQRMGFAVERDIFSQGKLTCYGENREIKKTSNRGRYSAGISVGWNSRGCSLLVV